MTKAQPHLRARPLDPKGSPRRWQCVDCDAIGESYALLAMLDCTAPPPPPCAWCGQTPICAEDCMGIAVALAQPGVEVVGGY